MLDLDWPSVEPGHIAGNDLLLVRMLILGSKILWDWDGQHHICVWRRVHIDLGKYEVHHVSNIPKCWLCLVGFGSALSLHSLWKVDLVKRYTFPGFGLWSV